MLSAKHYECKIISNVEIASNIFLLKVALPSGALLPIAGQFYMLRTWGKSDAPTLSRPISVHNIDEVKREIHFLYELRGIGTQKLSQAKASETISLTGSAGNGFPVQDIKGKIALVAGGIGIAPMLLLAKTLTQNGCKVDLYCGFRDEPYALQSFSPFCGKIKVATDSGNYGTKGFVTELFNPKEYACVCTCGPDIMMQKTAMMCSQANTECYVSLEAKMACGVGACLGCKCKTLKGGAHVCKDGPVFLGGQAYAEC